MKKIVPVLLLLMLVSKAYAIQYFSVQDTVPKYGCPNTTHDVTITVKNNFPAAIPANSYSYTVTFYHADLTTDFYTYSPATTPAIAIGGSLTVVLSDISFTVAEVCSVAIAITATGLGSTNISVNYPVQNPPTLTIEDPTAGTLDVLNASTQLSTIYKAKYYADGNEVTTSDDGVYTPTTSGSYTAKGYEPISGCLSTTASNAISISVVQTAVKNAQNINASVYPNPMAGSVTISSPLSETLRYELADMNGNIVHTGEFTSVTNLNVEALKAGSYVLTVKDSQSNTSAYKLLK